LLKKVVYNLNFSFWVKRHLDIINKRRERERDRDRGRKTEREREMVHTGKFFLSNEVEKSY
jgi:hypothetical protein